MRTDQSRPTVSPGIRILLLRCCPYDRFGLAYNRVRERFPGAEVTVLIPLSVQAGACKDYRVISYPYPRFEARQGRRIVRKLRHERFDLVLAPLNTCNHGSYRNVTGFLSTLRCPRSGVIYPDLTIDEAVPRAFELLHRRERRKARVVKGLAWVRLALRLLQKGFLQGVVRPLVWVGAIVALGAWDAWRWVKDAYRRL